MTDAGDFKISIIMKKIYLFVLAAAATFISSCEGPAGPAGPAGFSAESVVYETAPIDFSAPSFGMFFTFPTAALQSDHVLAYRLVGTDGGNDVWKLLPEQFFFDDGTFDFAYNYDFTRFDVNFFIEGQDLGTLPASATQNQIFRVVIVPGYFANRQSVDYSDYNQTIRSLGLEGKPVVKLK